VKHALFYAIGSAKFQDGVLQGVSVITKGEAKGHGLFVDDGTLTTFLSAVQSRTGGVPVKMDHGGGFAQIVGKLENFRIEGDSLRADLHLIQAHEAYRRIVEMAEKMPEGFGLSAAFDYDPEKSEGKTRPRCKEIHSVDLVDTPAANPTGLFQSVDSPTKGMAENIEAEKSLFARFKGIFVDQENAELTTARAELATLKPQVAEFATQRAEFAAQIAAKDKEITELKAAQGEFDKKVELAAATKAQQIMAAVGQPAPIPSAPAANPGAPAKAELSNLHGLDRVVAAFKAQSTAKATNLVAK
jgi:hypothetical protein